MGTSLGPVVFLLLAMGAGARSVTRTAMRARVPVVSSRLRATLAQGKTQQNVRNAVQVKSSMGPAYDAIVDKIINPPSLLSPEEADNAIRTVLGLVGVSFFATFGVAPQFKATLKEEQSWKDIHGILSSEGVTSVTAKEAVSKAAGNGVLLDVRMEEKFASKSLPGATNIPLYRPIQLTNPVAVLRALGFAFFGVSNSERTPGWLQKIEEAIPKGKNVYIICNTGGSLENKPGTKFGFESQSLKAVHFLRKAGYSNVFHVKEGMREIRL
ncbi:hypothetical protein AAMO2058_001259400 [Amorphochlora amoebiformis]